MYPLRESHLSLMVEVATEILQQFAKPKMSRQVELLRNIRAACSCSGHYIIYWETSSFMTAGCVMWKPG